MPILAQKFVFFIHNTKMPFSCETTLWEHRMSRSMREIFHRFFCWHFQHCLKHIRCQNTIIILCFLPWSQYESFLCKTIFLWVYTCSSLSFKRT
jgi:hypothetical protein